MSWLIVKCHWDKPPFRFLHRCFPEIISFYNQQCYFELLHWDGRSKRHLASINNVRRAATRRYVYVSWQTWELRSGGNVVASTLQACVLRPSKFILHHKPPKVKQKNVFSHIWITTMCVVSYRKVRKDFILLTHA